MTKLIAYQTDNGVAIVVPTGAISLNSVILKDVPNGVNYKIIEPLDLPEDEYFRDAWIFDDGVKVDLNKAKEIHKNIIRKVRSQLLEELDIQFQRALESGKDTSKIVSQKNSLRDATNNPSIEKAKTLEELKSTWDVNVLGPSPYQ